MQVAALALALTQVSPVEEDKDLSRISLTVLAEERPLADAKHTSWILSTASNDDSNLRMTFLSGDELRGIEVFISMHAVSEREIECASIAARWTDIGESAKNSCVDLFGSVTVRFPSRDVEGGQLELSLEALWASEEMKPVEVVRVEGVSTLDPATTEWFRRVSDDIDVARAGPPTEVRTLWGSGAVKTRGVVDSQGRRVGTWRTWYPDGVLQSESEFQGDVRNGRWVSFWKSGNPFEQGNYVQGNREGVWTERWPYNETWTISTGPYFGNNKEGIWVTKWANGTLRAQGAFVDGLEDGLWSRWWPNGTKRSEGRYVRGISKGEWTFWNEDGSLREVANRKVPPWARE